MEEQVPEQASTEEPFAALSLSQSLASCPPSSDDGSKDPHHDGSKWGDHMDNLRAERISHASRGSHERANNHLSRGAHNPVAEDRESHIHGMELHSLGNKVRAHLRGSKGMGSCEVRMARKPVRMGGETQASLGCVGHQD